MYYTDVVIDSKFACMYYSILSGKFLKGINKHCKIMPMTLRNIIWRQANENIIKIIIFKFVVLFQNRFKINEFFDRLISRDISTI